MLLKFITAKETEHKGKRHAMMESREVQQGFWRLPQRYVLFLAVDYRDPCGMSAHGRPNEV